MATCVSARSGAPWATNSAAIAYPVAPRNRAPENRRRTIAAANAMVMSTVAIGTWAGSSIRSGQPCHHGPLSKSTPGTIAAVRRITPR